MVCLCGYELFVLCKNFCTYKDDNSKRKRIIFCNEYNEYFYFMNLQLFFNKKCFKVEEQF
jgi:hypothetical protein